MPPHHYWELPPGPSRVPRYREDFGMYMVSEVAWRSVDDLC
jgi:hypothetical protein